MTKRRKKLNIKEAESILRELMEHNGTDKKVGINWANFRKAGGADRTFRITAEKLSLTSLIYLVESEFIEDVYFHPSVAPPRDGIISTAMRYHLYITFND